MGLEEGFGVGGGSGSIKIPVPWIDCLSANSLESIFGPHCNSRSIRDVCLSQMFRWNKCFSQWGFPENLTHHIPVELKVRGHF